MKKIVILLILAVLTGCSLGLNTPAPEIKQSAKPVVTVSSIPKPVESSIPKVTKLPVKDGTGKIQQSGEASNAPSPLPTSTPTPEETSNSSEVKPSPIPSPSATPWPTGDRGTPKPRFDINKPVEEGVRKGYIDVFFKDTAKIRYKTDTKEFISLAGADVANINKLFKQYSIKTWLSDAVYGKTEEELEKKEKESEAFFGVDFPNEASIYPLYTETPINVKEFIEALRLDPSVLSTNENGIGYTS